MIKKLYNSKQAGITIFVAVAIMSLLLAVTFMVINVVLKGTIFTSSAKDSQLAFFAADSGIECAVYWDAKFDSFATSSINSVISCNGLNISTNSQNPIPGTTTPSRVGGGGDANPTSIFGFYIDPGRTCAIVTVNKRYVGQSLQTVIKSRGYNSCDVNSNRRVERGLEFNY